MKNWIVAILSISVLLTSCDKVDQKAVAELRKPVVVEFVPCPDKGGFPDSVDKVVFLEDYTGHTCGNCPKAHAKADELSKKYACQVVIAGIHCSAFATPYPSNAPKYTYDFRTPAATELDNFFGASGAGLPKGLVNRIRTTATNAPMDEGKWEAAMLKEFAKKSVIKIESKANVSDGASAISFETKVKYLQNVSDTLNFAVYVLEDSIYAWQTDYRQDPNPRDVMYYHRHVFRKAVTGTFGDPLLGNKARKDSVVKTFSIPLDPKWNAKKLSIITLVSRESANSILKHKVLQANEVKVK
jgi:thiol-disulfide isomerase/thioredoxin